MSEQNFDEIEELGDDDLLEDEDGPGAEPKANRTLKLDRSEFHRAQALAAQMEPTASPSVVVPPAPITSPILEPRGTPRAAQPASISPVAIDTSPLPTLPPPARVPEMSSAAMPRDNRDNRKATALPWLLGAAAVFVLVAVGGSIAGYMVVSKTHETPTAANAPPSEPKTMDVDHANASSVDTTPATAPQKADQAPGEVPTLNVGSLPTAPAHPDHPDHAPAAAAPAPKPEGVAAPAKPVKAEPAPAAPPVAVKAEPAKAAPAAAPKTQATTGIIKLPEGSKALTVIVDGGYHRVNDAGLAVVKCGHHSVRAGSSSTQEIDVPCGGMVTLQ